jgi:hypothetical protein
MENNNNQELYADLFAYRFALLDMYEDNEIEIIKKLKYKLIDWGYREEELSEILRNFYSYYLINIDENLIDSVRIYVLNFNRAINNELNLMSNHNPSFSLLLNRISEFIANYPAIENENQEDIKITVEEEAIEQLPIVKITEKEVEDKINCSICMEPFNKDDEAKKLICNHLYHHECIKSHLLNYDYKCPLCRTDVGNHKINI